MTDAREREILDSVLIALIIVGGFILMVVLAIYGYVKMRGDDFWEERS